MFKECIGKKVQIIVSVSVTTSSSLAPVVYEGVIKNSDEYITEIDVSKAKVASMTGTYASAKALSNVFGNMTSYEIETEGTMFIKNDYIISVLLI